ncbi:MAG: hypothetical protein HUK25_04875 [Treponema sp.]|nr:hypothetical protein [Treponema sp.]
MNLRFSSESSNLLKINSFFSKKKVDIEKKIQEKYIYGDVAVIAYRVFEISDIIDPHSVPGHEILTRDFLDFLETNTEYIDSGYPIVLEICGREFTDEEKSTITRVIKENCDLLLGRCSHEKKDMIGWMIFNGICAIASYVAYALFNGVAQKTGNPWITAIVDGLNIFFWVFTWEIVAAVAFKTKGYLDNKKKAAQMASMNIRFYDKFGDSTYSKEEQNKVVEEILNDK